MSVSEPQADRRGGLMNVVDIVIAPSAAFARLREVPAWGWAFLAASLLGIVGILLSAPASRHALDAWMPSVFAANPEIQKLPPEQQQKQIARALGMTHTFAALSWIIVPFIVLLGSLVQAAILTAGNAIGRGSGTFSRYFALSATVQVVGLGIGSLLIGVIAMLRGPDAFTNPADIQTAVPNLAMLAPSLHGFARGFLAAFSVTYIWATVLLALGMIAIGRVRGAAAWSTAIAILVVTALWTGFSLRQS